MSDVHTPTPADTEFVTIEESETTTKSKWTAPAVSISPLYLREVVAEFLGTFILVTFGVGVNLAVTAGAGSWLSVTLGWALGIFLGVRITANISGGHINPAITIASAVYGKLSWAKVPGYVLAQLLGAFVAAFLVFFVHKPTIDAVDPDRELSRGNFGTYPAAHVSNLNAFYTEFLATAIFLLAISAVTDKRVSVANTYGSAPVHVALSFLAIAIALGNNTGFALNPARDFGPRLFTAFAGYGFKVFTVNSAYFWIPIVAPVLGAIAGVGVYKVLVENLHPAEDSE